MDLAQNPTSFHYKRPAENRDTRDIIQHNKGRLQQTVANI